jgi:UDP-glucose 4-epimerase
VIWVTGASGYIGRSLCAALVARHHDHIAFARSAPAGSNSAQILHHGDLTLEKFKAAQDAYGPPTKVFHLAGGSTVGNSLARPALDFESNVGTSLSLFEFIRTRAPNAVITLASSAAVYGSGHTQPIPTDTICLPDSPYGFHKYILECLATSYSKNFGLNIRTVRLFSVYGEGLRKQLLWDICNRLKRGVTHLQLEGTGEEQRDFCHISLVLEHLLAAAESSVPGNFISNCATGNGITVREIATKLVSFWDAGIPVTFSGKGRTGDPAYLVGIPESQCQTSISLDQGLQQFVDWHKRDVRD